MKAKKAVSPKVSSLTATAEEINKMEYQGHPSWNCWNVSLWIGNDEGLYRLASDCIARSPSFRLATRRFLNDSGVSKTPDGAVYNWKATYLALKGLELPLGLSHAEGK